MTNCPNCGAPVQGAVCEYCGTHFSTPEKQNVFFYDVYKSPRGLVIYAEFHSFCDSKIKALGHYDFIDLGEKISKCFSNLLSIEMLNDYESTKWIDEKGKIHIGRRPFKTIYDLRFNYKESLDDFKRDYYDFISLF